MTRNSTIFLCAVFCFALCSIAHASPWKTYVNERFGFQLEYPANLKPGRAPANGAGMTFSDGKFSVTAQGHFLNGRTIGDFYQDALNAYGNAVTYKVKRSSWYVVSGVLSDGTEFYQKFHVQGGNWAEFSATYPAAMAAKYNPVIERMAKGFVPFLAGSQYDRAP